MIPKLVTDLMIKDKYYDLDNITNIKYITGWWFQTFVIFHNIWDVILPIDFHIFQHGYCTTNQIFINHH